MSQRVPVLRHFTSAPSESEASEKSERSAPKLVDPDERSDDPGDDTPGTR